MITSKSHVFLSPFAQVLFSTQVTDFGLSMQTNGVGIEHTMSDACGTLVYMGRSLQFFSCVPQDNKNNNNYCCFYFDGKS